MSSQDQKDSLQKVNDSLYKDGRTDGLPVVPPTEERVEEMLRGTDLAADHEIGRLGNREGILTVEKLATNAVMAGCRPIHLPVLIAGAEALADPASNSIQVSVSTGSWSYLWSLNGPIRDDIDVNSGTGAFGPGFRANRSIGRALGMAYRNTALIHPGEKDMGVLGNPFRYSLIAGENEEQSPWEPYHSSRGFDSDASTITFGAPHSYVQFFPAEMTAEGQLEGMLQNSPTYMTAQRGEAIKKEVFFVLSPYNAQELGEAGYSKQDVKEYLCENALVPREKYTPGGLITEEDPGIPPQFKRQFKDPDLLNVLVMGGSGRWNAILGHSVGGPVTKEIRTPDNWDSLLEEYTVDRNWGKERDYYEA